MRELRFVLVFFTGLAAFGCATQPSASFCYTQGVQGGNNACASIGAPVTDSRGDSPYGRGYRRLE